MCVDLLLEDGGGAEWLASETSRFGPRFGWPTLAFHCLKSSWQMIRCLALMSGRMSQQNRVCPLVKEICQLWASGLSFSCWCLRSFGLFQSSLD